MHDAYSTTDNAHPIHGRSTERTKSRAFSAPGPVLDGRESAQRAASGTGRSDYLPDPRRRPAELGLRAHPSGSDDGLVRWTCGEVVEDRFGMGQGTGPAG